MVFFFFGVGEGGKERWRVEVWRDMKKDGGGGEDRDGGMVEL